MFGSTPADLGSDVNDYERCRRVAFAAYQPQLHGLIAPSAGGNGDSLAPFDDHLSSVFRSVVMRETWQHLPADPRRLRAAPETD